MSHWGFIQCGLPGIPEKRLGEATGEGTPSAAIEFHLLKRSIQVPRNVVKGIAILCCV